MDYLTTREIVLGYLVIATIVNYFIILGIFRKFSKKVEKNLESHIGLILHAWRKYDNRSDK